MSVTVTAKKTEHVEVVLSYEEVGRIAINALCEIYNIRPDYYLDDGGVWYESEWYGHKTEYEQHRVRDASPSDIEGILMIKKLREWVNRKREESVRKAGS